VREAWTNSFGSQHQLDLLGLAAEDPRRTMVELVNPTSDQEPALRTLLLPNLLASVAHNVARQAPGVALFEIARVYRPGPDRLADEPTHLCTVLCGRRGAVHWRSGTAAWDFFAAKGVVEAALDALRLPVPRFAPLTAPPWHPTRAARVGEAGELGELHPDVCERFAVPDGTVAFELDLRALFAELPGRPRVADLPRFPSLYIDLAVVVDESAAAGDVQQTITSAGAPELASVRLFDVYRGEQVGSDKKSLAFALELRSAERTLSDPDADAVRARIVEALLREHDAELRV
jgi:phenylalanyl-tRNA synthetase beta chain